MGLPRQEYWSGLPFPSPGDLLDPEIEAGSPTLPQTSSAGERQLLASGSLMPHPLALKPCWPVLT